jgi:ATP-binding cassette subfamily F protein uup
LGWLGAFDARLLDGPGTLLLVSHARRFLDNVVTSTLAFEGGGKVSEYVGGYEDWVRQRPAEPAPEKAAAGKREVPAAGAAKPERRKLTFKEQRELTTLPDTIAALEAEQRALESRAAGAEFYKEGADAIRTIMQRLEAIPREIEAAYRRWDELDSVAR